MFTVDSHFMRRNFLMDIDIYPIMEWDNYHNCMSLSNVLIREWTISTA